MPTCQECGNNLAFSSSKVSTEVPCANPPFPLQANFATSGQLESIEYAGNEDQIVKDAWEHPEIFFDTCGTCGSQKLEW